MTRAILLLGLLACNKDKDPASGGDSVPGGTDSGGGDDSAAPPVCDVVALDATWPEDGLDPASRGLSITVSYTGTASAEGVVATEQEIQNRIYELARRYQMPPDRFEKEMEKNNALGRIADEVRLMKTVSWLYDQARIEVA